MYPHSIYSVCDKALSVKCPVHERSLSPKTTWTRALVLSSPALLRKKLQLGKLKSQTYYHSFGWSEALYIPRMFWCSPWTDLNRREDLQFIFLHNNSSCSLRFRTMTVSVGLCEACDFTYLHFVLVIWGFSHFVTTTDCLLWRGLLEVWTEKW